MSGLVIGLLDLEPRLPLLIYATADEADAYMFYRCFFFVFLLFDFCFLLFPFASKIPDNRSQERLNGFS